jgi:two-component system, cell cycle response regulator
VSQQATEHPSRPRILLVGDASARPTGLERALSRAGFHLIEQEEPGVYPSADAVLITLSDLDESPPAELLSPSGSGTNQAPPRLVLISSSNPDAPAAALALGAADALVAPVHLPELCARLYARIRERRQPSPSASQPAENGREPEAPSLDQTSDPFGEELEQRVQEEFERARRYSLSFSLILLGIDELPGSDEQLEADATGRLHSEVGRTLRRELRVPDLVVPYGTSEFAIVLPETGQTGARQSVMRIREILTSLPFPGDPRLEPTRFSAGIVTFPHPAAHQAEDLFDMAEAALMRGRAQATERIGVAM